MWPVIDRTTVILFATCAVRARFSLNTTPGMVVFTTPSGPRYSMGASGLGSHDSWCARPLGKMIWMTLFARPSARGVPPASGRTSFARARIWDQYASVNPSPSTNPTWIKLRRPNAVGYRGPVHMHLGCANESLLRVYTLIRRIPRKRWYSFP